MAQYYQVLGQSDKNLDEPEQFYQESDESHTVQYVITPEKHQQQQQFQTQQVVVASSGEQLMVVDGQQQQVIIEPSQVAYQTSSAYIIQEPSPSRATFHAGNRQQQVYYMANNTRQIVVEQQPPQPVVLNHQMMQNLPAKVVQQPMPAAIPTQMQQVRPAPIAMRAVQQRPALVRTVAQQQQQAKVMASPTTLPGLPKKVVEAQAERKGEEYVTLPDGTFLRLQEYQKLVAEQKQSVELTENSRIMNPAVASSAVSASVHPTQQHQHQQQMAVKKTPARNTNARSRAAAASNPKPPRAPAARQRDGKFMGNSQAQLKAQQQLVALQQQQQQQLSLKQKHQQQQQYQAPQQTSTKPPQLYRQQFSPAQAAAAATSSQNQYIIQPPRAQMKQQQHRPLPPFLHTSQIKHIIDNTPMSDEYSDSIRMLVLLDNGEQRLITFTLPKEACTIQEILEQVNVPFQHDTPIQVTEANTNGINYVVAVGHIPGMNIQSAEEESDSTPEVSPAKQLPAHVVEPETVVEAAPKPPSPEPQLKDLPFRRVEGRLAVCGHCGYLSEDFNRCLRCKKVLPESTKAVPADAAINAVNGRKLNLKPLNEKKFALPKPNGTPKLNLLAKKVRPVKQPKVLDCETVVVSSDEEDSSDVPKTKNVNEQLLEKLGSSVTLSPISKEPSIVDIQKTSLLASSKGIETIASDQVCAAEIYCRTVRIGSYRFVPLGPVHINSTGVVIKVPHPKSDNTVKLITVEKCDIVKVLISYQKSLPVLFYYLSPSVGVEVRSTLDMCQGGDYYFDPLSESEESHRRITLLPEVIPEETKQIIQRIYSQQSNVLEELNYKEANDILIKTCPKEVTKSILSYNSMNEIKCLLLYPPEGRGRISINTEDYMCLGQDQFLNDVIIDFYLKYLVLNLGQEEQEKVHVFSTFFYKRLTTKPTIASRKSQPSEMDPNLNSAQKRHARVKTWTKGVNIFEKDFIIVPINENCHWFLAIICFPNMDGTHTMDGKPIKIEPRKPKQKKTVSIGSGVTVTPVKKEAGPTITCDDGELSDKDEAEGDESELDSDGSEDATPTVEHSKKPPIKQPCILIFDSLAGASRTRVVATLRDYLTCEYKAKMNAEKTFTKDVIKGACPKVPQQTNFTDCGLYVLQYVEQFFEDPIKDYHIPITHLKTWFEEIVVTRKREEISSLIMSLMKDSGRDVSMVPTDIIFPTQNGEIVERSLDNFADMDDCDEEMEEDDDEDYVPPPPPTPKKKKTKATAASNDSGSEKSCDSPVKSSKDAEDDILTNVTQPDLSELKTTATSNKDTLSYLKAKRIIRHKNVSEDGPDQKKAKVSVD